MSSNVFLTKWSEISGGRFDPLMVLYKKTTQSFKYETIPFKDLLLSNPMYGANEAGIERTDENEPRYIRITDIDEFGNLKDGLGVTAQVIEEKYFLNENDLLFARSGATVGKAYIHRKRDYECFFAGYMIRFVVDSDRIDPYYVFLYTQLDIYKKWVLSIQRAAGQPNINAEEYKSLPIPIPPKQIQEELVTKIQDAYKQKQQKEDEAKKLIDSIDEYLLKELGIVLSKVDETDISKRVFLRKWSEISGDRFEADYYSNYFHIILDSFQKSTCKFITLNEITKKIKTGTTPNQKLDAFIEDEDNIPFLRNSDIQNGEIIDSKFKYIKNELENQLAFSYKNEIIICIAGTIGISALNTFDRLAINQNVSSLIIDETQINIKFLLFWLNTKIAIDLLKRLSSIATIAYVNNPTLLKLQIPLPAVEKQNKIASHIENIREQAKSLKQQAIDDFEKAKKEVEVILLGESNEF